MESLFGRQLTPRELKSFCQTIKPIIHPWFGKSYYLRKLSKSEMRKDSFTWMDDPEDFASEVDYSKLKDVADVTMLHRFHCSEAFNPTVEEIVSQIPEEYLDEVIAFEIVYAPSEEFDLDLFRQETQNGYHVFVVRLYGKRHKKDAESIPPRHYPEGFDAPRGMDEEVFKQLRAHHVWGQWVG